jgi:hypothetical protein
MIRIAVKVKHIINIQSKLKTVFIYVQCIWATKTEELLSLKLTISQR